MKQFKAENDDELSGIPTSGTATATAIATAPATTTVTATETVTDVDDLLLNFEIRNVEVKLGNAFVRLSARNRRKVLALVERPGYQRTATNSNMDRWSKDEMKCCYQQLQAISPKMANDLRRWASLHVNAKRNYRTSIIALADELECRRWMEEPSFYIG